MSLEWHGAARRTNRWEVDTFKIRLSIERTDGTKEAPLLWQYYVRVGFDQDNLLMPVEDKRHVFHDVKR